MINKIGAITAFIFVVLLAMPITQQATHFNRCVQFKEEVNKRDWPQWTDGPKGEWHSNAVAYCNAGYD